MRRHLFSTALFLSLLVIATSQLGTAFVLAETETLVDSTVEVPNLNYYTFSREIDIEGMDDVSIQGTIEVTNGFVSFYVMDSPGYANFQKTGDADFYLYRADNIRSQSVSVPIAQSGMYHIVLDNQASLLDSRTVRVQLVLSFERPGDVLMGYAILGGIGVVIIVAVFLIVRRVRRRRASPASSVTGPAAQAIVPKYCVHCGAVMHQMARTCPACGREQRT